MESRTWSKPLTEKDLLTAGWERASVMLPMWRHPEVRDGQPLAFVDAVRAEEIRRTRDGG